MSTTDLRIEQLVKTYPSGAGTLTILKDLDLQVSEGQKIAISGASGCGKTTLLHLIGGMDQPDSGRILFGEQDLSQIEPAALALYRNRKVGSKLLGLLCEELDVMRVDCLTTVDPTNSSMLKVCNTFGFSSSTFIESYYRANEDRFFLKREALK